MLAYNNSVSAATGLAPIEVHMNRLPRLPLTVVEHHFAPGHQSLARDHLEYCDLAADHQRRAYALVREQHALTASRMERRKISSHRSVRGRDAAIAVLYETHWNGLLRPPWEREADLLHARQHILEYWTGALLQLRQANLVYGRMRVGAAQRELARAKGARFLPPEYSYVNHHTWARRFRGTILSVGAYFLSLIHI